MGRLLVITHPDGGTSGVLAQAARTAGHELEEWSVAGGGSPRHALDRYDALVVLGGGQNVGETDRFPYLSAETDLIAEWHEGGRPLLGVCLGAELLAQATGGAVVRIAQPEIGWFDVERSTAGAGDPLLGAGGPLFRSYQWHSYAAELPPGAVELARNASCAQAFRLGNSWGVQFHPEVTAEIVEAWIDDWQADPDAVAQSFDAAAARADLARELPAWSDYGRGLFGGFCGLFG